MTAMTELKVFRWAAHLIPGIVSLVVATLLGVPVTAFPGASDSDAQAVARILSVTALGLVGAYVLGAVIRDVGYTVAQKLLAPFIPSPSSGSERPAYDVWSGRLLGHAAASLLPWAVVPLVVRSKRNTLGITDTIYEHRRAEVRRHLKAIRRDSTAALERLGLTDDSIALFAGRFRTRLLRAAEELPVAVGPRLLGEWEHLGMLQALLFIWLGTVTVATAMQVFTALGLLSLDTVVPKYAPYWGLILVTAGLALFTARAFEYRNRMLARDVAIADQMLASRASAPQPSDA